jgi:hypothetical protein
MSKTWCFTVEDREAEEIAAFALTRAAPVGSLAIVAIREYIARKRADELRSKARRKGKAASLDLGWVNLPQAGENAPTGQEH